MSARDLTRPADSGRPQRFVRFGAGSDWSVHHLLLAGLATLGVALYLVALAGASGGMDAGWWLLLAVPLMTWSLSNSAAALALWTVLLVVWINLTPAGSFSWWSLLAAGGVTLPTPPPHWPTRLPRGLSSDR